MRKFSEREKEIIRRLVDGASGSFVYLPINAYGDIFYREKVEFVYKPTPELRYYSLQGSVRNADDIFKVSSEIYEISYLIDYLEKEGMLRHFSIGTGTLKNDISGFSKAGLTGVTVALDPAVGEMLYNNLNYPIYVTQTLESLVKDNIEGKLEATMNNTADIRMELQDTLTVNVAKCPCKKYPKRIMPTDSCKRTVRINICEDTVVSKQSFKK